MVPHLLLLVPSVLAVSWSHQPWSPVSPTGLLLPPVTGSGPKGLSEVPRGAALARDCSPSNSETAAETGGRRGGSRLRVQLPQLVRSPRPLPGGGQAVLLHLRPRLLAHWWHCHTRL